MSCLLNREYCFQGGGCGDCPHNSRQYEGYQKLKNEMDSQREEYRKTLFPNVILPLIGEVAGHGFFIQNYFVTAGHCVENTPIQIFYKGEYYTFRKEDAVIFSTISHQNEFGQKGDYAVFKFPQAKQWLEIGEELDFLQDFKDGYMKRAFLLSYQRIVSNSENKSTTLTYNEIYKLKTIPFKYLDDWIDGKEKRLDFGFEASTFREIKEGYSGCPLLNRANKVVGILIGCRQPETNPSVILFQNLNEIKYSLFSKTENDIHSTWPPSAIINDADPFLSLLDDTAYISSQQDQGDIFNCKDQGT